jgi:molecular chaperone GrpE
LFEDDPAEDPGLEPLGASEPVPVADVPAATMPAPTDEAVAEAYQQRARLAEDRLAEVLAAYREFKRETESSRERLSRQLERKFEHRHDSLLLKFIDILDNFDRALEASQAAGQALIEGLILVRTQLLSMLQDEGLERIPVLGLPFDPHLSEAVGAVPVDDPDQHHVVMREMLRGYRLNGRIARPSQVMIGEYAAPVVAAAPAAPEHDPLLAVTEAAAAAVPDLTAVLDPPPLPEAGDELPPDDDRPVIGEGDLGLSLDDIIARVEAQDTADTPEASDVPTILYDDLTEISDSTLEPAETVVLEGDDVTEEIGGVDPSDWTKED